MPKSAARFEVNMYKTKSGDSWDLIAHEQLGSSRYTPELMKANRDKLEYFTFPAGVELKMPEVEKKISKKPPWK